MFNLPEEKLSAKRSNRLVAQRKEVRQPLVLREQKDIELALKDIRRKRIIELDMWNPLETLSII